MATKPIMQWDAEGHPITAPVQQWDAEGHPIGHGNKNMATIQSLPHWTDPGGIAYHLRALRNKAINELPSIGGAIGGLIGIGTGAESGPGALVTGAVGAAGGGALGEDAKQAIFHHLYPKRPDMSAGESAEKIGKQAALQGAAELAGEGAGRMVGPLIRRAGRFVPEEAFDRYPFLKKVFAVADEPSPNAARHLTAAASEKVSAGKPLKAITNTLGELEGEMQKLPAKDRTVAGFLGAVNARKSAIQNESAMALLPIRNKVVVPTGIADDIRGLLRSYMPDTVEGRQQAAYIKRRAVEFEKPMTYGSLDEMRTDLSAQLAAHRAKGSVAKYTARKGDLDLSIDNAILDGLRHTVYPEMDRAAGKPAGYFENLKAKQSNLITLQDILEKRYEELAGKQAISEVTPRLSSENISLSAHAGSPIRAGIYGVRQMLSPPRELKSASKHVLKAFPDVNSLPYQILFSDAVRVPGAISAEKSAPPVRVGAALSVR